MRNKGHGDKIFEDYHRNGVCGLGFTVAFCHDKEFYGEGITTVERAIRVTFDGQKPGPWVSLDHFKAMFGKELPEEGVSIAGSLAVQLVSVDEEFDTNQVLVAFLASNGGEAFTPFVGIYHRGAPDVPLATFDFKNLSSGVEDENPARFGFNSFRGDYYDTALRKFKEYVKLVGSE